jgi:multiple sugar transport system ATP-binding protein
MATVTLDQVSKVYANGVEAVHKLDLEVGDGEFLILVGPSGCGKTTALRMVAGLEDISSGCLSIGGQPVNNLPPKDRDIAMVFQNYALYPHMTVAENIGFALRLRRIPKAEVERKVSEAAAILGLTEHLDRKPRQLSGGQRQRVAMGRSIVRDPAIFLMDEPLSNLDAQLRVQMRAEVSKLQRRLGVATLYVTHDQVEAMTMGDRVAVLRGGRLQQCAAPQVLYDHPANIFVASFIGSPSMNLYRAGVSEDGQHLAVGSQTIGIASSDRVCGTVAAYRNREVVVGIRPEDLVVGVGSGGASSLVGEVELVEALGSEALVYFRTDATSGGIPASSEAQQLGTLAIGADGSTTSRASSVGVARLPPSCDARAGQRIELILDPDRLHVFDPDTGDSLRV